MTLDLGLLQDVGSGGLSGKEEYPRLGANTSDAYCGLHAVDVRHENIGDNDIGAELAGKGYRILTAQCDNRVEAFATKDFGEAFSDEFLVIDDEHSALGLAVQWIGQETFSGRAWESTRAGLKQIGIYDSGFECRH